MKIKCWLFGHKFKPDKLIETIELPDKTLFEHFMPPRYFHERPIYQRNFVLGVKLIDALRCEHCGFIERG